MSESSLAMAFKRETGQTPHEFLVTWWRYEQTAYYTDGVLRLGYALGDGDFIAKGLAGIDYTLAHATAEGFLGHECMWNAGKYDLHKGCIMWPMGVFFRAMKAGYEAAPDPRIPDALAKYYLLYDTNTVSLVRNVDSAEGMTWVYGITGDRRLLDACSTPDSARRLPISRRCSIFRISTSLSRHRTRTTTFASTGRNTRSTVFR